MLWRLTREQIVKAVLAIVRQRGFEVKKVYDLSSGLYIAVQLSNGHIINIQDYEIRGCL